jgi:endoribonuclease Dicer
MIAAESILIAAEGLAIYIPRKMSSVYANEITLATTLATRTTEQVQADLKRLLHKPHESPSKRRQSSDSTSARNGPNPSESKADYVKQWASGVEEGLAAEDGRNAYDDDEDDEDEVAPTTKVKKITERKRRQNAIADSHIQNSLQKAFKKSIIKPAEQEQQSARWLVNQSESHKIISTPRAYQTELFEKAKEGNIIAVLDTGMWLITCGYSFWTNLCRIW